MRVKGLDGRDYHWSLTSKPRTGCSSGHERCRRLLALLFPFETVCEEVRLPGSGKLVADFVLPGHRLLIEVHGRQHDKYVPFFHGNRPGYMASLGRDHKKKEWAELNGYRYVGLADGEPDRVWGVRLTAKDG